LKVSIAGKILRGKKQKGEKGKQGKIFPCENSFYSLLSGRILESRAKGKSQGDFDISPREKKPTARKINS